jgi:hypothetical protein
VLTVQRQRGHFSRFPAGELQQKHRVPSDTLIYDLQYRLRCKRPECRRSKGMRILLWDGEPMPSRSAHDTGRHVVIVEGYINARIRL